MTELETKYPNINFHKYNCGLLDTDLYKITQKYAVQSLYPNAYAKYKFINRGKQRFDENFLYYLKSNIKFFCNTTWLIVPDETNWLKEHLNYINPMFFDALRNYKFKYDQLNIKLTSDNNLELTIEGPWQETILWEIPLMSLISQTYFTYIEDGKYWNYDNQYEKAYEKAIKLRLANCKVAEFGTRRRRSLGVQELVIKAFLDVQNKLIDGKLGTNFVGTSNVALAMKYGTKAIGTFAHEWVMGISALESFNHANYFAMQNWSCVFNANLGTVLTDNYGLDSFLKSFNLRFAKTFDSVRHDSGDPFVFTDKIIAHYKKLNINPLHKTIVFSDGLDVDKCIELKKYCEGKIDCSFGIGTHLTNDFKNSPALNMVIKLTEINGTPVVKLSDNPLKATGDPEAIKFMRWVYNV